MKVEKHYLGLYTFFLLFRCFVVSLFCCFVNRKALFFNINVKWLIANAV